MSRTLVCSLIPIALAYHLAHFLSFLIIPLASDPFGFGWNLFNTTDFRVDIAVVNARFTWIVAVVSIIIGHIIAVYVAHTLALRLFKERKDALKSQWPMLILMVGYTIASLWILAQPITTG